MKKKSGSLLDVAQALGRHRATISKYRGRSWFEVCRLPDGSWDVAAAVKAIEDNINPVAQYSVDQRHNKHKTVTIAEAYKISRYKKETIRKRIRRCEVCGKIFYSTNKSQKACSLRCGSILSEDNRGEFGQLICEVCGKKFKSDRPEKKYCSSKCANYHSISCIICKKQFWHCKYQVKKISLVCKDCKKIERWRLCETCKKAFIPQNMIYKKYCSHKCANIAQTGRSYKKIMKEKERNKDRQAVYRASLNDAYLKKLLSDKRKPLWVPTEKITPELIEAYREILTVKRNIKELKEG